MLRRGPAVALSVLVLAGQSCISEARALEIAKDEYRKTVLQPMSQQIPGFVICEDPIYAYAFEAFAGFRVTVHAKDECLSRDMLDGEGHYFVSSSGVLLRSSTREEHEAIERRDR